MTRSVQRCDRNGGQDANFESFLMLTKCISDARLYYGCCPVSFRLLPGFTPGIVRFRSGCCPISFRKSSGLTPTFERCCDKHEALLKPFCALLNQT